jgi:MFS family permease
VQNWNLPDAQASAYMVALQAGLAVANLVFGFLADRMGHKWTLEVAWLLSLISLALALLAPAPAWFFAIFFLRGAVNAASFISGISIVYEFTVPENRPTYIGLANTLPGVVAALAPLAGGWLAAAAGYPAMFLLSALLGAASLVMLCFGVREPRTLVAPSSPLL